MLIWITLKINVFGCMMHKWFVWSRKLMRYIPIPGLFSESRGENPAILVTPDGGELPSMYSIPMFGKHNAVRPGSQA